jgi:hypothetical protein
MGNPAPIRGSLSDISVIMAIMCVLVEDMTCQVVTGQILVFKCLFVRSAWVLLAISCHARHKMSSLHEVPTPVVLARY